MLKKNEAVVEVYKKKVDQIGDLRIELAQALERNTHLNAENDLLQQDKENLRVFEGMVEKLQGDISKVKLISDQKDLSVQDLSFSLSDSESRNKEHEQKELFFTSQIDKLNQEVASLSEEILVIK